jgi:hypothetical protein
MKISILQNDKKCIRGNTFLREYGGRLKIANSGI